MKYYAWRHKKSYICIRKPTQKKSKSKVNSAEKTRQKMNNKKILTHCFNDNKTAVYLFCLFEFKPHTDTYMHKHISTDIWKFSILYLIYYNLHSKSRNSTALLQRLFIFSVTTTCQYTCYLRMLLHIEVLHFFDWALLVWGEICKFEFLGNLLMYL